MPVLISFVHSLRGCECMTSDRNRICGALAMNSDLIKTLYIRHVMYDLLGEKCMVKNGVQS